MLSSNKIHPTAILENVVMGEGNEIGPYCVLKNVRLGSLNKISSHVCIGGIPEVTGCKMAGTVEIGSNNVISEFVTIHSGWQNPTVITHHCMIQRHAHIAHDCFLSSHAIIGGAAMLGGHAKVLEHAFVGGGSTVHQFVVIGAGAFIGAQCHILKHVEPFSKIATRSAARIGDNERKLAMYDDVEKQFYHKTFISMIERKDPTNARQEITIL